MGAWHKPHVFPGEASRVNACPPTPSKGRGLVSRRCVLLAFLHDSLAPPPPEQGPLLFSYPQLIPSISWAEKVATPPVTPSNVSFRPASRAGWNQERNQDKPSECPLHVT